MDAMQYKTQYRAVRCKMVPGIARYKYRALQAKTGTDTNNAMLDQIQRSARKKQYTAIQAYTYSNTELHITKHDTSSYKAIQSPIAVHASSECCSATRPNIEIKKSNIEHYNTTTIQSNTRQYKTKYSATRKKYGAVQFNRNRARQYNTQ